MLSEDIHYNLCDMELQQWESSTGTDASGSADLSHTRIAPPARRHVSTKLFSSLAVMTTLFGVMWWAHNAGASAASTHIADLEDAQQLSADVDVPSALGVAELGAAVNGFGLELLRALHSGSKGGNIFLSPLSVTKALAMVALGATQDSKTELELLHAWRLGTSDRGPFFGALRNASALLASGSEGVQLLDANGIWTKSSIKEAYKSAVTSTFAAEANALPSSPAPINEWCEKATHGMIPSIMDSIDPLTVAVVVNAVYFKGVWSPDYKFNKYATTLGTFHSSQGPKRCAMMQRSVSRMPYVDRDGVQVVELPYGSDGRFAAVVMLPQDSEGALSALTSQLGGSGEDDTGDGAQSGAAAGLETMLAGMRPTSVKLRLPRFKVEFGVRDLTPQLRSAFGIQAAFDDDGGFLPMSDDESVHLSQVLHKAVVEVNEEGTKASAASAGVMNARSIVLQPPDTVSVVVDRPFLFLIREVGTGILLFAGTVEDPELDTSGL